MVWGADELLDSAEVGVAICEGHWGTQVSDLRVAFCGLGLKNPIVAASSPATESLSSIVGCVDAGAAAVITKSIADIPRVSGGDGYRRAFLNERGLWATSTFSRETLSLEAGLALVSAAVHEVEVPVIASLAGPGPDPHHWLEPARLLEDAGAAAIQLDLFYAATLDWGSPDVLHSIAALLSEIVGEVRVPVIPKLNIDMPLAAIVAASVQAGVGGLSFLDSVALPPPITLPEGRLAFSHVSRPSHASLFGRWQLPLTLRLTHQLVSQTTLPLCAGGGIWSGRDALETILLGAHTVQVATVVLLEGFSAISRILAEMDELVAQTGLDIEGLRSAARAEFGSENQEQFTRATARLDERRCNGCGRCAELVFCQALFIVGSTARIAAEECDGCSLCTFVCPSEALSVVAADSDSDG